MSHSIGEIYTPLTEYIENTGNTNLTLPNEDLQFVWLKATATDNKPNYNDIILAYNGNVLVGSAKYNDETVLLIMGRDVSEQTVGFLEEGEKPQLKLYQSSTCALIDL